HLLRIEPARQPNLIAPLHRLSLRRVILPRLVANRKRKRDRLRALGLRQVEARPAQHHEARRALAPVDPRQHPPTQDRAGDEVPPIVLAQPEPVPLHATRQVAARCVEQTALVVAQHFLPRLSHAISLPCLCASSMRRQAMSKYLGSRSMPMKCKPRSSATTPTVPLPMYGSMTVSPGCACTTKQFSTNLGGKAQTWPVPLVSAGIRHTSVMPSDF